MSSNEPQREALNNINHFEMYTSELSACLLAGLILFYWHLCKKSSKKRLALSWFFDKSEYFFSCGCNDQSVRSVERHTAIPAWQCIVGIHTSNKIKNDRRPTPKLNIIKTTAGEESTALTWMPVELQSQKSWENYFCGLLTKMPSYYMLKLLKPMLTISAASDSAATLFSGWECACRTKLINLEDISPEWFL